MKKTVLHKAIALLGAITMLAGVAACGHSNNADESGNGLKKSDVHAVMGARHQPHRRLRGEEQGVLQAGRP